MKTEKKEFKIGEEFQMGLIRIKCVEAEPSHESACKQCLFYRVDCASNIMQDILGSCTDERNDRKDVVFKRLK